MSMSINGNNGIPKNIEGRIVIAFYGPKFSQGVAALKGKNELSFLDRQAHLRILNDFGKEFSQLSMDDKDVVLREIGEHFLNFNSLLVRK